METRFETENGNVQDVQVSLTLQYLAPWVEKTDGLESVGAWENNLATKMMVKLLELWITPKSRVCGRPIFRSAAGVSRCVTPCRAPRPPDGTRCPDGSGI